MRSALAGLVPGVDVRAGTSEAIPLPDASVDAVAVAQAFHWFASEQALAEIARVLTSTGRLGLVWNRRDLTLPLQAAISEIIEPHRGSTSSFMTGDWREAFQHTRLFVGTAEHQVPLRAVPHHRSAHRPCTLDQLHRGTLTTCKRRGRERGASARATPRQTTAPRLRHRALLLRAGLTWDGYCCIHI